ncbi:MAG: hypothetical protein JWN79_2815 [Gemmatimonadetes bacterium]|jgi:uncharacterized protein YpmB|nr:hypothetical protein [Gemmatimonadota bacterium]
MKSLFFGAALVVAAGLPVAAQTVTGQVQPSTAARVKVKADPSLAASARVSADSAFAIARAHADWGEVSSAKLETKNNRLVYQVQVLNKSKRETTVTVDAMTGAVIEAEQHGGLKSTVLHHKENKKLLNAKRDSAARNP